MEPPQIQYATTSGGVNIAYFTIGEGIPLLIANGVGNSDMVATWDLESPERIAEAGFRVIRFDWRCTGSSDRTPVAFSVDAFADDVEAVVRHAIPAEQFAVLSFGSACYGTIGYVDRHPERLLHLFLSAPIADGSVAYESMALHKGLESLREFGDDYWDAYTRATAAFLMPAGASPELADRLVAIRRNAMTPDAARAYERAIPGLTVLPLLPKLNVPTLVFVHQRSMAPVELQRAVAAGIPNAKAVVTESPDSWRLSRRKIAVLCETLGMTPKRPGPAASPQESRRRTGRHAVRTVLFTDMEGNTEMLQRLGDEAWRAVLREHERVTRDVLRAHGGTEVKTMGDGFMASFDLATSAVECAIDLQLAFAASNDATAEPIRVRVGINAGEPIAEGDDLFGAAVTMASRITSQGRGEEILVSDVVRGLVAGKGFSFIDRGDTTLKGFEEPVRIYAVRWGES